MRIFPGLMFFLYVEQDVVLWERDKGELRRRVMMALGKCSFVFGFGQGTPQILQQSFFAIHRRGMRQFLAGLHGIEASARNLSPETKFHIALTRGFVKSLLCLLSSETRLKKLPVFVQRIFSRLQRRLRKTLMKWIRYYQVWDFGYGRLRPINFDDDIFYFQHGSEEELLQYR